MKKFLIVDSLKVSRLMSEYMHAYKLLYDLADSRSRWPCWRILGRYKRRNFLWRKKKPKIVCAAPAAAAKSLQSCPTLCDPIDGSPPGSAIPGFLQARTLEWVAISFSNAWKWKVKVKLLSRVRLSATPWTAAFQAPPSMGFSRQECWSGVPLPSLVQPMAIRQMRKGPHWSH